MLRWIWVVGLLETCLGSLVSGGPAGLFDLEAGRPAMQHFRPTDYMGHPQAHAIKRASNGYPLCRKSGGRARV